MAKELLSGNEAIARGAYEAGVTFASAYPGTPSTEILENVVRYKEVIHAQWGVNEKTAMEEALGASFTGARALVAMKHVGLNVAADPLFSASYIGATGALIIISADDPGMHSSQNEQDNRHYAIAAKIPVLEPSDSQEAKDMVIEAVKISESFDTPVLIRMTTRTSHSRSAVELGERLEPPVPEYKSDFFKRNLLPGNARRRHVLVEERQKKLAVFSDDFKYNTVIKGKNRIGVVASGVSYQYGREVFPDASFLKLAMPYPFPVNLFKRFAAKLDTIYILEENDPIIETFARLVEPGKKIIGKDVFPLLGEMSQDVVQASLKLKDLTPRFDVNTIPRRPPSLCTGCPHTALFYNLGLQKVNSRGDIGCYTLGALPPLSAMDTCVDMGASITVLLGIEKALAKAEKTIKQVAVIGDSTFFHSGITGLIDVIYNKGQSTVVILDNSITAMTGHQENPGSGTTLMGETAPRIDIVKLVRDGLGLEHTYEVDGYDVKAIKELLKREILRPEPSVIVVRRPCILLYRKAKWSPMRVDGEACTSCKVCLRLGCPAISSDADGKAFINEALCSGCGVCAQVCAFKAISFVDDKGLHSSSITLESYLSGDRS
ncbi:MAG: indolepyruvate ferredoxin oxidoreductase subunit alpha [Candidatus Aminicenantes bacterium]|nr:indolepyruvate ferredoxin oxidoreductase subunit alpha [Candidatus Aminicenantes bacterium]